LLLSREFAGRRYESAGGAKTRRPLGLAAAFARAMEIDLAYAEPLSRV